MKSEKLNRVQELLSPIFAQNGVIKAVLFGSLSQAGDNQKKNLEFFAEPEEI